MRDRGDLQRRQLPKTWPFQVGKREAQHRRESVPASRGLSNFPLQSGRTGLGCSVSILASGDIATTKYIDVFDISSTL